MELLAGERRLEAAKIAGLATVPVRVLHGVSDVNARGIALTENLSRADLQPWERALGLRKLQEVAVDAGDDVDVRSLGRIAGVGKTTAAELLRIAERLGGEVLTELEAQGVSDGLRKLSKAKLLNAAEPDSVASRCERLLGLLGRRKSRRAVSPFVVKGEPTTGMTIRLSRPVSRLRSREAQELLQLVIPLVTALEARAE
jgi:ParB family chromosome partitioning protein